jgi:hypothetical protein
LIVGSGIGTLLVAVPQDAIARKYYRAAVERLADADTIFDVTERMTASVYLGGYAVEFILKALIVSSVKPDDRVAVALEFRGAKAHSYEWLRERYTERGGSPLPAEVTAAFVAVGTWGVELRYNPVKISRAQARQFLSNVKLIFSWAERRL